MEEDECKGCYPSALVGKPWMPVDVELRGLSGEVQRTKALPTDMHHLRNVATSRVGGVRKEVRSKVHKADAIEVRRVVGSMSDMSDAPSAKVKRRWHKCR